MVGEYKLKKGENNIILIIKNKIKDLRDMFNHCKNLQNINNNDNNMQIDSNINQGINMINAPYSSENLNKSKEELNKKMDIFINNAMNMNINPFSSPFGLTDINPENNNTSL